MASPSVERGEKKTMRMLIHLAQIIKCVNGIYNPFPLFLRAKQGTDYKSVAKDWRCVAEN